jgi:hypothetical protein
MSEEAAPLLLAFVALKSDRVPDPERLLKVLRKTYPVDPAPEVSSSETSDQHLFFDVQDGQAIAALLAAPIPWGDLEGPCHTAWWWPEATRVMRRHSHHLLAVLQGVELSRLEQHVWLTRFIAALCETSDAVGVYWGNGTLVHEARAFCDAAAKVSVEDPDPFLWIDMRLSRDEKNRLRFFTTGMKAFGLAEVEVDRTSWEPNRVLRFCGDIIMYLLKRGPVIRDGETVGQAADERFKVRFASSMWDRDGKVMKIALP